MNQKLNNWQQELDPEAEAEYKALRRSLQRNNGFGLFFVQCTPATGENIIAEIKEDIKQKNIKVLRFTEPIDSLYDEVVRLPDIENTDILFIYGLEHSLYEYEAYTFNNQEKNTYNNSQERYSQSWRGIPRFLGYLNLQRDRFREDFAISFVFLVPIFGMNYFIKRAPDFFDWRSGFFRFIPHKESLTTIDIDSIFQGNFENSRYDLLDLQTLNRELPLNHNEQTQLAYKQFLLAIKCQQYEKAIVCVNRWLADNPDDIWAWYGKGVASTILERYEEAIASYDKALEINPNFDSDWYNRGIALDELGRYEEAIASYDKTLEINPNDDSAWHNRGIALDELGRYKEAVTSFDKALELNPNFDLAWYNRVNALLSLGKYEEIVAIL